MRSLLMLFLLCSLAAASRGLALAQEKPKRELSGNAWIKALTVSRGKLSPRFKSKRLSYKDSVADSVNHILVQATAMDPHAKLSIANLGFGTGKLTTMAPLFGTSTRISVVVVAEDAKTTRTYQITVTK